MSRRALPAGGHAAAAVPSVSRSVRSQDYLLDKAQTTEKLLTVFTGPIFREDDPSYGKGRTGGPWKIPLSFWKIAVLQKTPTKIAAAAFIVGQTQYVQALYEAKVFSGLKPYTLDEMRKRQIQTTIKAIEEETGLDFSWCVRSMRKERWSRPDRQGGSTI